MKIMKGLIIIMVFAFAQCAGTMNKTHREMRQNIADTLEHFDKMGKDGSCFLNNYEAEYFNMRFQREDFDFMDKKVFFFGPGGLVFSDKQRYFNELTRHTFVQSSLHVFNETEREKAGGFDAVIVYWNKRNYSSEDLLKRLKENNPLFCVAH